MKITSNLLGTLGAAIKRSVVEPHETDLTIPPIVAPEIEIPEVLRAFGTSSVFGPTTLLNSVGGSITNGVATSSNIFALEPGLWRLQINICYGSNYSSNSTQGCRVQLLQAGGTIFSNLANLFCTPTAGGVLTVFLNEVMALDQFTQCQVTLGTNGVGQTHEFTVSALASKLL